MSSVQIPVATDDDAFTDLISRVRGQVFTPTVTEWELARLPWNVAVPQAPSAVVRVADADDVASVVRWARERGRVVAAQPSGHGATTALDGTVLVRTGALDEIEVDAAARIARVGAGVKWGDLLAALEGTGLIALAGSNPDVTVVGYLLGGGLSWFGRAFGYAAHDLRAVELVDPAGRLRRVTDASDPDLMWALRGGGGDLGIVTGVELDLHLAPEVYGGKLMFPIQEARSVWAAFLAVTRTAPRELSLWAALMHFPAVDFLPEQVRGRSFATVDVTFLGGRADAERLLAPIRAAGNPLSDTVGEVPIERLGEVAAEPTDPTPSIDWSSLLSDVDGGTLERVLDAVEDRDRTALVSVQLRHLGGALAEGPGPSLPAGAAAERIREPYLLWGMGVPMVPELVEPIRGSIAALAGAVAEEMTGRTTLTLLGGGEPLERVFDDAALVRLRAIKRGLDASGTIRGNHPVADGG